MKNRLNIRFSFLGLLSVFIIALSFQTLNAQNKTRIKTQYVRIVDSISYVDIVATSKIEKDNVNVTGVDIIVFNELEDENVELGKITTNHEGKSRFIIVEFKL